VLAEADAVGEGLDGEILEHADELEGVYLLNKALERGQEV